MRKTKKNKDHTLETQAPRFQIFDSNFISKKTNNTVKKHNS